MPVRDHVRTSMRFGANSMDTYEELLDFAYALAEKASAMIRQGAQSSWRSTQSVRTKKSAVDPLTETDTAVEAFIKTKIRSRYPLHKFIGEETYAEEGKLSITDDITWVVDPIDGTMNFVHNNPFVACSIGVMHKKRPVVGVIAQPFLGRIFSAAHGKGAFLNRSISLPLTGGRPKPLATLAECMVIGEWGSDRTTRTIGPKIRSFERLAGSPSAVSGGKSVHAIRSYGSSACDIVAIAAGEADVYYEIGCYIWDVCAGIVILEESGGFSCGSRTDLQQHVSVEEWLEKRRYIFVRAIQDDTQHLVAKRLATELYQTIEDWSTSDMA